MKPHQRAVLGALGALHPHPAPVRPDATAHEPRFYRDPVSGQFVSPPGVTLNGGPQLAPPAEPVDGVAAHNAFLAELIGPKDLGA